MKIDLGPEEPGPAAASDAGAKKSLLELRRQKRSGASGAQGAAAGTPPTSAQGGQNPAAGKISRSEQRRLAKKDAQAGQAGGDEMGRQALGPEDGQMPMLEGEDGGQNSGKSETLEELEELSKNRENVKKLAGIDELSSLEEELLQGGEGDEFDLVDKELESGSVSCPKCGNPAEGLVYCPDCGDAFCDHCAKKIEALTDAVKYTCGKCGAEFRKKKSK